MDHNTCLELALEGERLCKGGDFHGGVAFFEAAIRVGTDDLKTLSAVYSQLGNAYFYLGDYSKAMEYHKCDLTVARAIGDHLGEGKASGNLGNTLKVMGKFDEAVVCCRRHLDISQELGDKVGEGRALYNLGNVYHAKGKHIACLGHQDPGEFPEEVKACLQKAVEYYEESLKLMIELDDRSAQGRACGNLGNTHYLLGNFSQAVTYHEERLKIAKEYGDKAAERRAHNNLGNAHIFLGEFEVAAENYQKTLALAEELGDKAVEAQACYSLGNTYTLLHEYQTAIEYHLRHLRIAQELRDRVGEGRAYWSLGNAHSAIGNHEQALHYANRHLEISKEIGDHTGEITAQMSISDLRKLLSIQSSTSSIRDLGSQNSNPGQNGRARRISMEKMDLLSLTPDARATKQSLEADNSENKDTLSTVAEAPSSSPSSADSKVLSISQVTNSTAIHDGKQENRKEQPTYENSMDEESFFELLSRFQSKRMDDQRCSLVLLENKENNQLLGNYPTSSSSSQTTGSRMTPTSMEEKESNVKFRDELFDLIAGMQSRRLDEQRASLPRLPGLNLSSNSSSCRRNNNNNNSRILRRTSVDTTTLPDDDFFDMLIRCQDSRIEDQRSSMPNLNPMPPCSEDSYSPRAGHASSTQCAPTVPDEDFFSLIMRFQAGRIEDQRSVLPTKPVSIAREGSSVGTSSSRSSSSKSTSSATCPGSGGSGLLRSNLKTNTKKQTSKH